MTVGTFSFPFYPMRPKSGPSLCAVSQVAELRLTHHVQPKLNGDRACLALVGGRPSIQNRHGGYYRQSIDLKPWVKFGRSMTGDLLLDGEVVDRQFFPFEAIVVPYGDVTCPSKRAWHACQLCVLAEVAWLFEPPTDAWLVEQLAQRHDSKRRWEGIVAKRLETAYVPSGTEGGESSAWFKLKFR